MSKYLEEKHADEVDFFIGRIKITTKRNGRTDAEIARDYHMKNGFEVIRVGEHLYRFNEGREVQEVPRIRGKVLPLKAKPSYGSKTVDEALNETLRPGEY